MLKGEHVLALALAASQAKPEWLICAAMNSGSFARKKASIGSGGRPRPWDGVHLERSQRLELECEVSAFVEIHSAGSLHRARTEEGVDDQRDLEGVCCGRRRSTLQEWKPRKGRWTIVGAARFSLISMSLNSLALPREAANNLFINGLT